MSFWSASLKLLTVGALAGGGWWAWNNGHLAPVEAQVRSWVGRPATPSPAAAPAARPRGGPVPVFVATAQVLDVPIEVDAIGTVVSGQTQLVRSRIDGEIAQVHFEEGAEVMAGDVLFTLDNRQIQAQLRQAEANLARNRTALANARREVDRFSELAGRDVVSRQRFDDIRNQAALLENSVRADEAVVEALRVQASYTTIRAAISGRTGQVTLTKGNTIRNSDAAGGTAVTIVQTKPIDVRFALAQRHLGDLRRSMAAGTATVVATPPGAGAAAGIVEFIDNQIETTTGTFQVKAAFANDEETLWPGMFVSVRVRLGTLPGAVQVPSAAVQVGQRGTFVYVARADQTVELRPVKVVREDAGRSTLESGVAGGERVVIDGHLRLSPGAAIQIREPGGARPPSGTPPQATATTPAPGRGS
jgi:multidrug efflux system membrane fusion protein